MAKRRRNARCRICGRHRDEAGPMSARGKCSDCAKARMVVNLHGLVTHSGPALREWRRGVASSVGAVLWEDLPVSDTEPR